MSTTNVTPRHKWPLPHIGNTLAFDEPRLEQALGEIDEAVYQAEQAIAGKAAKTAMTGASSGTAGAAGLVPAPAAGDEEKFLCGDATWKTISGGGNVVVVGTPSITGDDAAAIGFSVTLTLAATSYLSGGSIASFEVSYNGGTANVVTATNDQGSITLAIPAGSAEGQVPVTCVAIDSAGNRSQAATKTLTLVTASIETPTASINKTSMYPNESLTITGSAFECSGIDGDLDNVEFAIFGGSDPASATKLWNSSGGTSTTGTVPANTLSAGTRYATVRYHDSSLGWSEWATPVAVTVNPASIVAPSITSPSADASIVKASGMSVAINAMSVTGGSDTQASFTVEMYSDSACTNLAKSKTFSGTGTSGTFSESDLSSLAAGDYYLKAYRTGTNLGASGKSSAVHISLTAGVISHGCTIYANADGETCTVLAKNRDGSDLRIVVPWSKYRTKAKFGTYGTDSPHHTNCIDTGWYLAGSSLGATADVPDSLTMDSMISSFGTTKNSGEGTSKAQSEAWYNNYKTHTDTQSIVGVPAVKHCIELTSIDGNPWYLPRTWVLMILWMVSDTIDSLDPYAASYGNMLLGKANTAGGRFYVAGVLGVWSSTECSSTYCLRVHYSGTVTNYGKNYEYGVVPVREFSS